jgi:PIN domain nuclease of toxin-antitoxin system
MNEYVADTHALYWYLTQNPRLGPNALSAFREGEQGKARIIIPSVVLAELYFLNIKVGVPLNFTSEFARLSGATQFIFVEFRAEDVLRFDALTAIPEMHDRIIAGVAMTQKCPCLTRDTLIVGSGLISVIW